MSGPPRWYVITPQGTLDPAKSFTVQGAVQLFSNREKAEKLADLLVTRDRREDYQVVPVELLVAEEENKKRDG